MGLWRDATDAATAAADKDDGLGSTNPHIRSGGGVQTNYTTGYLQPPHCPRLIINRDWR